MESLIELVAASFARHGIECPGEHVGAAAPGCPAERSSAVASELTAAVSPEPPLAAMLPAHNYRKTSQGDPAP